MKKEGSGSRVHTRKKPQTVKARVLDMIAEDPEKVIYSRLVAQTLNTQVQQVSKALAALEAQGHLEVVGEEPGFNGGGSPRILYRRPQPLLLQQYWKRATPPTEEDRI